MLLIVKSLIFLLQMCGDSEPSGRHRSGGALLARAASYSKHDAVSVHGHQGGGALALQLQEGSARERHTPRVRSMSV